MSSWRDKRVLITGAGGFIGSHLAERLAEEGARVCAFVHYNALGTCGWLDQSPHRSAMEVIAGDITDRDSVCGAVRNMDVVFHLAALIGIPYSYRAPASYIRTNIEGTMNVLHAVRESGVQRLVHTSTSEVYGTALSVPITEGHSLQGQSPYAASKIGADKMAEAFYLTYGVPVVIVRPFNTFGPRQSMRAIVPTIITQALSGGPIKLGNLTPTRDLNFQANTVDGFVAAGAATGAIGQTINLGSGREISIGDLVLMIARLIGSEIRIESDQQRLRPEKSEVERLLADPSLAFKLLGWVPKISLEDGLHRTIAWFQRQGKIIPHGPYVI